MTACQRCGGACCEGLVIPCVGPPAVFLRYHGEPVGTEAVELPCRCRMLDSDGRCTIYATRPEECTTYEIGGNACRDAVKRRRANWQEIFDAFG